MDLDGQREGQKPWQEHRARQVLKGHLSLSSPLRRGAPVQSYTWEGALASLPPLPMGPGLSESRSGKECGLPAAKEMSPVGAAVGLKSNFQLVAL